MGDGRKALAPCGHMGEVVIGTYVQCRQCDRQAVPVAVRPEKTEPMRRPVCPGCLSFDIEEFEDDLDAAFWFISNYRIPSSSPMPPSANEWGCHGCGKVFPKPA